MDDADDATPPPRDKHDPLDARDLGSSMVSNVLFRLAKLKSG